MLGFIMKKSHLFGGGFLMLVLYSVVSASYAASPEEGYICIPETGTGLFYSNGSWSSAQAKIPHKYLIRTPNQDELKLFIQKPRYVVLEIGRNFIEAGCDELSDYGLLLCKSFDVEVRFNKNTLRFIYFYKIGYINGEDENSVNPHIIIGKCNPL
jgi:hypothetical protein